MLSDYQESEFDYDSQTELHNDLHYKLRRWDYFCYTVGSLVRIQTIVIGYFLFAIETQNVCVVASHKIVPNSIDG